MLSTRKRPNPPALVLNASGTCAGKATCGRRGHFWGPASGSSSAILTRCRTPCGRGRDRREARAAMESATARTKRAKAPAARTCTSNSSSAYATLGCADASVQCTRTWPHHVLSCFSASHRAHLSLHKRFDNLCRRARRIARFPIIERYADIPATAFGGEVGTYVNCLRRAPSLSGGWRGGCRWCVPTSARACVARTCALNVSSADATLGGADAPVQCTRNMVRARVVVLQSVSSCLPPHMCACSQSCPAVLAEPLHERYAEIPATHFAGEAEAYVNPYL